VVYVIDRRSFLQIDRNYSFTILHISFFYGKMSLLAQLLPANLAPAAGCAAEIDNSIDSLEDVEDVIDL